MSDQIIFSDVHFSYPEESPGADNPPVLSRLSCSIPPGVTFLVGPNGIGKTTFMLLAGARLVPTHGTVTLLDKDSADFTEEERMRSASFVYQNMEFETDQPLGEVLDRIQDGGNDPVTAGEIRNELTEVAQLQGLSERPMTTLSKGEMQRAIAAMSLLYRSPVVLMDEPFFAVEPGHTEDLLRFLRRYTHTSGVTLLLSVHDVALARAFGDQGLLFSHDGTLRIGPAAEVLQREALEQAFQAPYDTLYERQRLYRQMLQSITEQA